MQKLDAKSLESHLLELPGWEVDGEGRITKEFQFDQYAHGLLFTAGIANLADAMNHHPDLTLGYQRVHVALVTHDAGGLTTNDIELAKKIESYHQLHA